MKVIITGSSKGLGFALASRFVKEGHDVAISSRNENSVQDAKVKLKAINASANVIGEALDYGNAEAINTHINSVIDSWGQIDVLINNVGIYGEDMADGDIQQNIERMIQVNLMSSIHTNNAIIPSMKSAKKGIIIHVVSIAAKFLRSDAAAYSISKLALKGYNDLLRDQLREYGVKVMALYPGAMNTSSWDETSSNRNNMIQMEDMGNTVINAINLSENATMDEIVINNLRDV